MKELALSVKYMALYQVQDPAIFNSTEIDKNNLQTAAVIQKQFMKKGPPFSGFSSKLRDFLGFPFCVGTPEQIWRQRYSQQFQNGLPKNYDGIYQLLLRKKFRYGTYFHD